MICFNKSLNFKMRGITDSEKESQKSRAPESMVLIGNTGGD